MVYVSFETSKIYSQRHLSTRFAAFPPSISFLHWILWGRSVTRMTRGRQGLEIRWKWCFDENCRVPRYSIVISSRCRHSVGSECWWSNDSAELNTELVTTRRTTAQKLPPSLTDLNLEETQNQGESYHRFVQTMRDAMKIVSVIDITYSKLRVCDLSLSDKFLENLTNQDSKSFQ